MAERRSTGSRRSVARSTYSDHRDSPPITMRDEQSTRAQSSYDPATGELSSSSSSSYIDISRTFPEPKPRGLGAIRTFFTAPSERRRVRRRKSRRLLRLSNSSTSSINSDLAYGSGYIKRGKGVARPPNPARRRDADPSNGRLPGIATDAAILTMGAELAAIARKQNRMDIMEARRAGTGPVSRQSTGSFRDIETSRGLGLSTPARNHGPDEEGWESADDSESEASSVDSKLAYGYDDVIPRRNRPIRKSSVVDPQLFGRQNSLHGFVSEPVGFQEITPDFSGKFDPPTVGALQRRETSSFVSPTGTPKQRSSSVTSLPAMQNVYPVPTSDPTNFDAARASVVSAGQDRYRSSGRPEPVPIQQPQPITPVSQRVYEPSYSTRSEPEIATRKSASSSRTTSVAGAALAGVAATAIGAAIIADRRDDRKDDRRRREEQTDRRDDRKVEGRRRRDEPRSDRRTDVDSARDTDGYKTVPSQASRSERETDDERERRRKERRERREREEREVEEAERRRRDKQRAENSTKGTTIAGAAIAGVTGAAIGSAIGSERRDDRRDEDRRRRDEPREGRSSRGDPVRPAIDPFQFQVADDAFHTPDAAKAPESFSNHLATVVTVDREPHFARSSRSSATEPENSTYDREHKEIRRDVSDQDRREREAEEIYQETEHFTAPIEIGAIGAAVAAVHAEDERHDSRHSRRASRDRGDRRKAYGAPTEKERDYIQEEADRVYREAVLARKIASSKENVEEEPIARVITPPGMHEEKKKGPFDAPDADFNLDLVMDPTEFKGFTPVVTRAYPSESDFVSSGLNPEVPDKRPMLTLVRPTPTPEAQEAREVKNEKKRSAKQPPPISTDNVAIGPKGNIVRSPTTESAPKGVTWGENQTKHYEVHSDREESKEDSTSGRTEDNTDREAPKKASNAKKSGKGWGTIAAALIGAGTVAAVSNETKETPASPKDGKKKSEESSAKSVEPFDYRGTSVQPETPEEDTRGRSPPPVGPKPSTSKASHMPGSFDDDNEFTATVAAGLKDSGFDPEIVINDSTFRTRTSPPGSDRPNVFSYQQPFAETVSDLGTVDMGSSRNGGAPDAESMILGEVPETNRDDAEYEEQFSSKLNKKEQRKREKAAKSRTDESAVETLVEDPTTSREITEEPETYFETKPGKKDKKKSKKSKGESYSFDEEKTTPSKVSVPIDAYDDVREAASIADNGATNDWDEPKKSKKKSKRSSESYDPSSRADSVEVSAVPSLSGPGRNVPVDGFYDVEEMIPAAEDGAADDWDAPKKSKKKSKRSSDRYDSPSRAENKDLPMPIGADIGKDFPIDEFYDVEEAATIAQNTAANELEDTPKKSSKRNSETYDSPSRRDPSDIPLPSGSEVSRADYDEEPRRSKKSSKRNSEVYDSLSRRDPTDVPLPSGSEVSRADYDEEPRKSKKSSKRGSEIYDSPSWRDPTDIPLPSGSEVSRADYEEEPKRSKKSSKRDSIVSERDMDDNESITSQGRKKDKDKDKEKEKKGGGGFFGLFGSKEKEKDKADSDRAKDKAVEASYDDFQETKKKKKSKRSSVADGSEISYSGASSVSKTTSNGNGYDAYEQDDRANGKTRTSNGDHEQEESFLAKAGTLGAGAGIVGAVAALAAQHSQSKADDAESNSRSIHESPDSNRPFTYQQPYAQTVSDLGHFDIDSTRNDAPPQTMKEHFQPISQDVRFEPDMVDPEISVRQFRPSIDPQYGDLLPLPPSDPGSPSNEPVDELPKLPESRPGSPKEQHVYRPERPSTVTRRTERLAPTKSPSAVPLKFMMGNRSTPSSPGFPKSSPLASPAALNPDPMAFTRSRSRPTSWEKTTEYQPLYLLSQSRRDATSQLGDMDTDKPSPDFEIRAASARATGSPERSTPTPSLPLSRSLSPGSSVHTQDIDALAAVDLLLDSTVTAADLAAHFGAGKEKSSDTVASPVGPPRGIHSSPEHVEPDSKERSSYLFRETPTKSRDILGMLDESPRGDEDQYDIEQRRVQALQALTGPEPQISVPSQDPDNVVKNESQLGSNLKSYDEIDTSSVQAGLGDPEEEFVIKSSKKGKKKQKRAEFAPLPSSQDVLTAENPELIGFNASQDIIPKSAVVSAVDSEVPITEVLSSMSEQAEDSSFSTKELGKTKKKDKKGNRQSQPIDSETTPEVTLPVVAETSNLEDPVEDAMNTKKSKKGSKKDKKGVRQSSTQDTSSETVEPYLDLEQSAPLEDVEPAAVEADHFNRSQVEFSRDLSTGDDLQQPKDETPSILTSAGPVLALGTVLGAAIATTLPVDDTASEKEQFHHDTIAPESLREQALDDYPIKDLPTDVPAVEDSSNWVAPKESKKDKKKKKKQAISWEDEDTAPAPQYEEDVPGQLSSLEAALDSEDRRINEPTIDQPDAEDASNWATPKESTKGKKKSKKQTAAWEDQDERGTVPENRDAPQFSHPEQAHSFQEPNEQNFPHPGGDDELSREIHMGPQGTAKEPGPEFVPIVDWSESTEAVSLGEKQAQPSELHQPDEFHKEDESGLQLGSEYNPEPEIEFGMEDFTPSKTKKGKKKTKNSQIWTEDETSTVATPPETPLESQRDLNIDPEAEPEPVPDVGLESFTTSKTKKGKKRSKNSQAWTEEEPSIVEPPLETSVETSDFGFAEVAPSKKKDKKNRKKAQQWDDLDVPEDQTTPKDSVNNEGLQSLVAEDDTVSASRDIVDKQLDKLTPQTESAACTPFESARSEFSNKEYFPSATSLHSPRPSGNTRQSSSRGYFPSAAYLIPLAVVAQPADHGSDPAELNKDEKLHGSFPGNSEEASTSRVPTPTAALEESTGLTSETHEIATEAVLNEDPSTEFSHSQPEEDFKSSNTKSRKSKKGRQASEAFAEDSLASRVASQDKDLTSQHELVDTLEPPSDVVGNRKEENVSEPYNEDQLVLARPMEEDFNSASKKSKKGKKSKQNISRALSQDDGSTRDVFEDAREAFHDQDLTRPSEDLDANDGFEFESVGKKSKKGKKGRQAISRTATQDEDLAEDAFVDALETHPDEDVTRATRALDQDNAAPPTFPQGITAEQLELARQMREDFSSGSKKSKKGKKNRSTSRNPQELDDPEARLAEIPLAEPTSGDYLSRDVVSEPAGLSALPQGITAEQLELARQMREDFASGSKKSKKGKKSRSTSQNPQELDDYDVSYAEPTSTETPLDGPFRDIVQESAAPSILPQGITAEQLKLARQMREDFASGSKKSKKGKKSRSTSQTPGEYDSRADDFSETPLLGTPLREEVGGDPELAAPSTLPEGISEEQLELARQMREDFQSSSKKSKKSNKRQPLSRSMTEDDQDNVAHYTKQSDENDEGQDLSRSIVADTDPNPGAQPALDEEEPDEFASSTEKSKKGKKGKGISRSATFDDIVAPPEDTAEGEDATRELTEIQPVLNAEEPDEFSSKKSKKGKKGKGLSRSATFDEKTANAEDATRELPETQPAMVEEDLDEFSLKKPKKGKKGKGLSRSATFDDVVAPSEDTVEAEDATRELPETQPAMVEEDLDEFSLKKPKKGKKGKGLSRSLTFDHIPSVSGDTAKDDDVTSDPVESQPPLVEEEPEEQFSMKKGKKGKKSKVPILDDIPSAPEIDTQDLGVTRDPIASQPSLVEEEPEEQFSTKKGKKGKKSKATIFDEIPSVPENDMQDLDVANDVEIHSAKAVEEPEELEFSMKKGKKGKKAKGLARSATFDDIFPVPENTQQDVEDDLNAQMEIPATSIEARALNFDDIPSVDEVTTNREDAVDDLPVKSGLFEENSENLSTATKQSEKDHAGKRLSFDDIPTIPEDTLEGENTIEDSVEASQPAIAKEDTDDFAYSMKKSKKDKKAKKAKGFSFDDIPSVPEDTVEGDDAVNDPIEASQPLVAEEDPDEFAHSTKKGKKDKKGKKSKGSSFDDIPSVLEDTMEGDDTVKDPIEASQPLITEEDADDFAYSTKKGKKDKKGKKSKGLSQSTPFGDSEASRSMEDSENTSDQIPIESKNDATILEKAAVTEEPEDLQFEKKSKKDKKNKKGLSRSATFDDSEPTKSTENDYGDTTGIESRGLSGAGLAAVGLAVGGLIEEDGQEDPFVTKKSKKGKKSKGLSRASTMYDTVSESMVEEEQPRAQKTADSLMNEVDTKETVTTEGAAIIPELPQQEEADNAVENPVVHEPNEAGSNILNEEQATALSQDPDVSHQTFPLSQVDQPKAMLEQDLDRAITETVKQSAPNQQNEEQFGGAPEGLAMTSEEPDQFSFPTKKSKKGKKRQDSARSAVEEIAADNKATEDTNSLRSFDAEPSMWLPEEMAAEPIAEEDSEQFFAAKKQEKGKKRQSSLNSAMKDSAKESRVTDETLDSNLEAEPPTGLSTEVAATNEHVEDAELFAPIKKSKKDKKGKKRQDSISPTADDSVEGNIAGREVADLPSFEVDPSTTESEPQEDQELFAPVKKAKKDKKRKSLLRNMTETDSPASDEQLLDKSEQSLPVVDVNRALEVIGMEQPEPATKESENLHSETPSELISDTPRVEVEVTDDFAVSTNLAPEDEEKLVHHALDSSPATQNRGDTTEYDYFKNGENDPESMHSEPIPASSHSSHHPQDIDSARPEQLDYDDQYSQDSAEATNAAKDKDTSSDEQGTSKGIDSHEQDVITQDTSFEGHYEVDASGHFRRDAFGHKIPSQAPEQRDGAKFCDDKSDLDVAGHEKNSKASELKGEVEASAPPSEHAHIMRGVAVTALAGATGLGLVEASHARSPRPAQHEEAPPEALSSPLHVKRHPIEDNPVAEKAAPIKKSKKDKRRKITDRRTSRDDDLFDDPALWEGAEPQRFDDIPEDREGAWIATQQTDPAEHTTRDNVEDSSMSAEKPLPFQDMEIVEPSREETRELSDIRPVTPASKGRSVVEESQEQERRSPPTYKVIGPMGIESKADQEWTDSPGKPVGKKSKKDKKSKKQSRVADWDEPAAIESSSGQYLDDFKPSHSRSVEETAEHDDYHTPVKRSSQRNSSERWATPTTLPAVVEEDSPRDHRTERDSSRSEYVMNDPIRDSAYVSDSPIPPQRTFTDDHENVRDSGVHLRDLSPARYSHHEHVADDALARLSWPAVDEHSETVNLHRSQRTKSPRQESPNPTTPTPKYAANATVPLATAAAGALGLAALRSHDEHSASKRDGRSEGAHDKRRTPETHRHQTPDINRLHTPEHSIRPSSGASFRSSASGTPPLRRSDRRISGDLRSLSQRSQADLAKKAEEQKRSPATSIVNDNNPTANEGRVRAKDMADVYDGFGEGRIGSPRSPTRPHSMRRRQSMQVLDLEARLEQLAAENRMLNDAKAQAESSLNASQRAASNIVDRDAEIESLKASLDWLQREVERLKEVNDGLTSANVTLGHQHHERYGDLESQHAQTTRELEDVRGEHENLSAGMESIVANATAEKDQEIAKLRQELDQAQALIRSMQQQILASKAADDTEFLTIRDEDYFDNACQDLCEHVQQWVLRFSKFSDMRACRLTSEISNDKIIDRLDNAVLDGSDVDNYLADRIKRRDIFMSMTMNMIWEFVFTRYLFGMDREQRQKLKVLEKTLNEVGPPAAVHQWRATTLTLLARRPQFVSQKEQDTEAVVQMVFSTLSEILPPPSQLEDQIQEQLRRVMRAAVNLSIEMRTQRASYMMLPPLQPEYDGNGELAQEVSFNASLMNERSGDTISNEDLEANRAVVRVVLFPLVVKKGDDSGVGDEEIVVCPAQVLVAKPKKNVRIFSPESVAAQSRVSMQSSMPEGHGDMI